MEVAFSDSFKKAFKERIQNKSAEIVFWDKLNLFIEDPFSSKLKTHKLSGKLKGSWSFSVEYDLRVVFFFTKDKPMKAVLVDIGNHDEVY
ncbi:type II toxin-antitoxin system mRNA interferase toxin, RelE/StbE family [Pedobacter frigidisoli]|uniref:Type II toxin-antitoxin system mRNA interferase toxin, RelE/StbE family n=1 Tax=Pedobacter frigidisoli TaxID=2530455 RepID=A0A4R0NVN3_9SPHI|nr:type II toxin-antitoxin system YafQ family toxin [Pedobacter frigidisoli]TCD04199.1 type II toxin-antitoxin system mRNA interferase toxin, RelE/StbE family [Pedobacter frigidisoli]